jgi:FixJ family two-component response regulator
VNDRRRNIALVDDDPRILESLGELFEASGYAVRAYPSAKAVIDAGLCDVDCLITDIGMAAVDGFELCGLVKNVRPDLPVFLITGRHVTGDQQRALARVVSSFFYKPVDGPALLAAVDDALCPHGGSNAEPHCKKL